MVLYALDSAQILTMTIILVPSLAAIWVIFLQRDLSEKIANFKNHLRDYGKKEAVNLFSEIKEVCQNSENGNNEKSLKIITDFLDEWETRNRAINELLTIEDSIYKMGKQIIILLIVLFISGLYSSINPEDLIGGISRLTVTQILFAIEVIAIFSWFLKIYNFAFTLNKAISGDLEDIEDIIDRAIKKS